MNIGRSLQDTKEGGLTFKMPKNGRARMVGIPRTLASELRSHRTAQRQRCVVQGEIHKDQGLIFPAPDGGPMNPHVLTRKFARFRTHHAAAARELRDALEARGKVGSPEHCAAIASERLMMLRWHDLRHSYAAQQLRAGEQVLVVSTALGHATTAFTMDVYGHVLPGEQQAAALRHGERIDAARARRRDVRRAHSPLETM